MVSDCRYLSSGIRRMGVSSEHVEEIQRCVEMVAQWCGKSTEGWIRVGDIEEQV
jgi:hypothetical protein